MATVQLFLWLVQVRNNWKHFVFKISWTSLMNFQFIGQLSLQGTISQISSIEMSVILYLVVNILVISMIPYVFFMKIISIIHYKTNIKQWHFWDLFYWEDYMLVIEYVELYHCQYCSLKFSRVLRTLLPNSIG